MTFGRENGPSVPYGATGVATAMAALLGVTGLLLPTALTESVAFQLYLDTIIASAVPPFGWLAKIVIGLIMALAGGLLGFGLARLLGVRSSGYSVAHLLARLRGNGRYDDDDAPSLRASDRHPDAPARRPFSVATDIPARDIPVSAWDRHWQGDQAMEDVASDDAPDLVGGPNLIDDDDDGELLLDSHYADQGALSDDDSAIDPVPYCEESISEAVFAPETPIASAATEDMSRDEHADIAAESPVAAVKNEPLDLSIARLDELLSRLEAGLASRRSAQSEAANPADTGSSQSENAAVSQSDNPLPTQQEGVVTEAEPLFPQDPALAAALATLRRMNQHVGS